MLTRNLVGSARPDVIRTEQIKCLGVFVFYHPVNARNNLLRRFLTGVDNVGSLLKAFIESRVVEHAVVLFKEWHYGFPCSCIPAATHRRTYVIYKITYRLLG